MTQKSQINTNFILRKFAVFASFAFQIIFATAKKTAGL